MGLFRATPNLPVVSPEEPKHSFAGDPMCQGSLSVTPPGESCVESPVAAGVRASHNASTGVDSPAKREGNVKSNTCNDCSLALFFPEKLYEREQESRTILEAFERTCSIQKSNKARGELLLITGSSGTGKTSLVESVLRPKVEAQDGMYVDGKFDLSERREQFYAIVQAMGAFAKALEKQPIDRLRGVRAQLASRTENVRIFLELCPKLSALLDLEGLDMKNDDESYTAPLSHCSGSSCSAESIDAVDATTNLRPRSPGVAERSVTPVSVTRERLKQGIRHFFAAICSSACPVVFFPDDLQWAEPASLDLLSSLIVDRIPGLLVVGACRDDEVDPTTSHLSVLLREVESMKATISQVAVSNVGLNGLSSMLLDSPFHMAGSKAHVLARLVLEKTNGNMLFVLLVLHFLVHEGLVHRLDRSWTFDSEEDIQIRLGKVSDARNLIDISTKMLDRLTQQALAVASCLGAEFSEQLLKSAIDVPLDGSLRILERSGLLTKPINQSGSWRFAHDQIQQCAYALIPQVKREHVHLQIGRNLWRALSEAELDLHANVVVTQLLLGADLINDREEREQLAILLLRAGESAAKSSAHATAHEYIWNGIRLLEARHWRDQYTLSLNLFNAAAEVEYCLGDFDRMDDLLEAILANARSKSDEVRAMSTRIYALGSRNEPARAIDVGIKALKEYFGESLPSKPSPVALFVELMKTKRMLRRLSDEDILSLPKMVDSKKLDTMRIMCLIWVYAVISDPPTTPVLTLRMVQYSLQFGLSGMSGTAFAYYGMLLSVVFDDVDAGIRYGKVGLRIVERFGAIEQIARVSNVVHGFSLPYRKPLRDQLRPMLLAHRIGLGAGDIQLSIMASAFYGVIALHSSARLSELAQELSSFIRLSEAYQQATTTAPLRQAAQFVQCMRGGCSNPSILSGSFMDWESALVEAKGSGITAWSQNIWLLKLMLASHFGKFEEAEIASNALVRLGMTTFTCFMKAAAWLHGGIAAIELSKGQNRRRRINQARRNLRHLTKLSGYSRHNYGSKASLLAAELAVARGDFHRAKLLYEESISLAKEARLWSDAALGCERLSRALRNCGRPEQSMAYDEAIHYYDAWGATAKAAELRKNRS